MSYRMTRIRVTASQCLVAEHGIVIVLYDVAVTVGEITANQLAIEAKVVISVNLARLGRLPDHAEEHPDLSFGAGGEVLTLEDRLREVEERELVNHKKLEQTMHEAHRAALQTMDLKLHDQMAYRVAAYAALTLNYYARDILLGGGPESDFLDFHQVYSHFTFMEKCAFDIALLVIDIERSITIPLQAQADVVIDFARCLRESSLGGAVFYPEHVGVGELSDILRQLAEPQSQRTTSAGNTHAPADTGMPPRKDAVSPPGDGATDTDDHTRASTPSDTDTPPETASPSGGTSLPARRLVPWGWLIVLIFGVVCLVVTSWWGGLSWGRHSQDGPPPLVDAGPARSGVPLGTNVSIRMLATYQGFDGQPKTVEAVSGIAPDTPAILTFSNDSEAAVLRVELRLSLTEATGTPDPDLQIAFGDAPLKPVGGTYRIDPEYPDGRWVNALTINPNDTHLKLGGDETIYQFDATLGDPSDYWCGYNTKPMVIYATNGTDPMVVASLPLVVFKDCSSTPLVEPASMPR